MSEFDEYIVHGEPGQKEKADAWQTAIGLQGVDGLKVSAYLLDTARQHIEGDITVNPDGSTEGGSIGVKVTHCSCTCHRDGIWPAIFRFFHKIIKMIVGHFVCCGNPDARYGS